MANEIRKDEEMRQCPICRMVISAWATKCRYCGEEVGRPKREEQRVTVKDLGGESTSTYTLSGNVKDALEAFRAEQEMAMEAQRRQEASKGSWFHKKEAPPTPDPADGGDSFSKLDARHKDLARSVLADAYTPRPTKTTRSGGIPEPIEKALKIVGVTLMVIVVAVALVAGGRRLLAHLRTDDAPVRDMMQNEALIMLSRGEPLIEAFEESVRVANFNDTAEDRRIMEDIRNQLVTKVQELLAASPYDEANQREAAALVERAVLVDPSSIFRNLKVTVDNERKAYFLVLKDFSENPPSATFTLNNDAYRDADGQILKTQTAEIYGVIEDRFVIQHISAREGVVLRDRERNGRLIVFKRKGGFARPYTRTLPEGS